MKISDLISRLQTIREEHGDLSVLVGAYGRMTELAEFVDVRRRVLVLKQGDPRFPTEEAR